MVKMLHRNISSSERGDVESIIASNTSSICDDQNDISIAVVESSHTTEQI